jgi:hypothetical protein
MYTTMNSHTKGFRNPIVKLFSSGANWRTFAKNYISMRKRRSNRTAKLILADDVAIECL